MKKLFFFRSSSPSSGKNEVPPPTDKQVYWEKPLEHKLSSKAAEEDNFYSHEGFFSKSRRQVSDSRSSRTSSGLRRSHSFSSAGNFGGQLEQTDFSSSNDHTRSPSSTGGGPLLHQCQSFCSRALTPERRQREYKYKIAPTHGAHKFERPGSDFSSGNSSCSNASSKVVDRYIDLEHQERGEIKKKGILSRRNALNGTWSETRPPRVQHLEPTSPASTGCENQRGCSFGEAEATRRLAKNVIERLSQSRPLPKDYGCGMPITIEDVYGGPPDKCLDFDSHVDFDNTQMDQTGERIREHHDIHDYSGLVSNGNGFGYAENKDVDLELQRRSREAEKRIMLLSEELEQETFLRDGQYDHDALMQRIRNLTEDKMSLALEISGLVHSRIDDRSSAKEELEMAKSELELKTLRLEKEKKELQAALEKELDRRSTEWSFKLEKYQLEEHRLRERVRELAEHNVSLQREVSSLHEKEKESSHMITHSEQQTRDMTSQNEELSQENFILRQKLSELQEKFRTAEEDRDSIRNNFERKDNECRELHKSVSRLLRTCTEQEKTIDGLRGGFSEEIGENCSQEMLDKHVKKLQMEQIRLTGIEIALRRELESYRLEVGSLRHENINLFNRLKSDRKDSDALTFKLDKEMWTRICCLQNQGLSMINESTNLGSKLLDLVKEREYELTDRKQSIEYTRTGLDEQFIIESEMKVQSLKRGTESLTRSLQMTSSLLQEKSSPLPVQPQGKDEGSRQQNDKSSEDIIRSELKAENLLTSLLREKIYSKELEVEQLQAELATAVRGNDILRCEVQNAMDRLTCVTHKLKDLELQMLKKDEEINYLQGELQDSNKELTIIKGRLPTVSEERDMMWEEVQQYSQKNMLLNSELNALKRKIEALDEDILIKEGQITILKDALKKNSFELIDSHDSTREFLLK